MPLNYRRNYKTMMLKRRIITISVVAVLFLLISGTIIYMRSGGRNASGIGGHSGDGASVGNKETGGNSAKDVTPASGKHGLALKRPMTHLYTIGIAKMPVPDVNREYTKTKKTVDDSYFDDALFIGDSRTEGFMMYSSLKNINAYCSKGLSITKIYEDAIVTMEDGRTVTVMEALQEQSYAKIYIMFGVNELGWPYDDLFEEQYAKVVYDIKQLQPDALIYVENIIPISAERSATDDIYNNTNVYRFNAIIEKVCKDQNVIYLDVASSVADETGALPADASTDGIHCNGVYCDKWLDYLKANTYTVSAVKVGTVSSEESNSEVTDTEEANSEEI
ncbi:MAG: hypothetical protein IJ079_06770 [Lachnospiraceae bacterium]|nr:hypothetical protein [Lachnospiraceae bacterium]